MRLWHIVLLASISCVPNMALSYETVFLKQRGSQRSALLLSRECNALINRGQLNYWGRGGTCYGMAGNTGFTPKPQLIDPEQYVASDNYYCALDQGKTKCWGFEIPSISSWLMQVHTSMIAAGPDYFCTVSAYDQGQNSLRCHNTASSNGDFLEALNKPTPRLDPDDVTDLCVGEGHWCAISRGALVCQSDPRLNLGSPPFMRRPSHLSCGNYHTCAYDEATQLVSCWGRDHYGTNPITHVLNAPTEKLPGLRKITSGAENSCAFWGDHSQCWGSARGMEGMQQALEGRTKVLDIASGGLRTCAIFNNGVDCWGKQYTEFAPEPLRHKLFIAGIQDLDLSLEQVARRLYHDKAQFVREIIGLLKNTPVAGPDSPELRRTLEIRVKLFTVAINFLEMIDMQWLNENVGSLKTDLNAALQDLGLEQNSLPDLPTAIKLTLVRAALQGSMPFMTEAQDRQEIELMVLEIGKAKALADDDGTKALAQILTDHQTLSHKLVIQDRTHAYGVMMGFYTGENL